MNLATSILTVGTALRHAQSADSPVELLLGTSWMTGTVSSLDGEGVALLSPTGEITVVRIASISAVRIQSGPEQRTPSEPGRPTYDGLHSSTLGVTAMPMPAAAAPGLTPSPMPTPVPSRV